MDFATQNIVISFIEGYQNYISPYNGFCCAHRALHHGASCSEWAKHAIKKAGVSAAFPLIIRRFKACNAAHKQLILLSKNKEDDNENMDKDYNPFTDKENVACCLGAWPCLPISS